MLNHIVIMGRLTRDPELRYTQSQIPVVSFTVAVDRDFQNRESGEKQTDFINCTAWRSTAEFINKYFRKGSMIVVSGRLQIRQYQDRDGNNRTAAEIVADNVYFGESRRDSGYPAADQGGYDAGRSAAYQQGSYNRAPARGGYSDYDAPQNVRPAERSGGFTDLSEDDGELPF